MSFIPGIDSLVEIRAMFFDVGDKAYAEELEDIPCWNLKYPESWQDCVEIVEHHNEMQIESNGKFRMADTEDVVFTKPAIGFECAYVTEGRFGHPFGCGIGFECSEDGHDWLENWLPEIEIEAKQMRALYEAKGKDLPVRGVCWIAAADYRSSMSYEGEYDRDIVYLGRITLEDVLKVLQDRSAGDATS